MTRAHAAAPDSHDRKTAVVSAGAALILLIIHAEHLAQPAVWDAAMGVFAPAAWLSRNGFDIPTLVNLPAWQDGGPNVYSLSLVTWITSLTMRIFAVGGAHIVALHVLHICAAAVAIGFTYRIASAALGHRAGIGIAAAATLFPPFLAQTSQMYLEIPVALATSGALWAALRRKWATAVVWAWFGALCKPTALVVAAVVALAALLSRADPQGRVPGVGRRIGRAALVLNGPLAVIAVNVWASSKKGTNPWSFDYTAYVMDCVARLRTVPDALLMLGFCSLGGLLTLPRSLGALASHDDNPNGRKARAAALCSLLVLAWVGFVLAVPLGGAVQPLLPRHVVAISGPLLVAGAAMGALVLPDRWIVAAAVALCAVFAFNSHGRAYPRETRSFAVAERSLGYRSFLDVQRAAVTWTQQLPVDTTVVYPLPDHYFMHDPLLGWAAAPLRNGHCARFESPWLHGKLADYPAGVVLLLTNPYHGGEALHRVVSQAKRSKGRRVVWLARWSSGGYEATAVEIQ